MEKMTNKRTVGFVSGLHLREAQEGERESRVIEGYALKFGVRSRLLCDLWDGKTYYEILEPGCVTRETLDAQDIKLTMYHDRQIILGRSKMGAGTLTYEVDEDGVKFACEMPHTPDGDTALELVRRGDIDGCSFIYSTEEDSENAVTYTRGARDLSDNSDKSDGVVRHVWRIDHFYDFTITPDPAFVQTEVSAREREALDGLEERGEERGERREEGERDARKREALKALRKRVGSPL